MGTMLEIDYLEYISKSVTNLLTWMNLANCVTSDFPQLSCKIPVSPGNCDMNIIRNNFNNRNNLGDYPSSFLSFYFPHL